MSGHRVTAFIGPLVIVAVGIVLLLNTTGVLSWGVWGTIGRLWPVVVILLGLSLLVRHIRRR
jgi:hypothetical protein